MSLSMIKQEVKSDMCVKVFVKKDNCANKIQHLVILPRPKRKGKKGANNQAVISSQLPRTRALSTIQ
jgi:hypothetical protein